MGSFWSANLGSFSAFLAPKFGQVRSKTRLESVSSSKTRIFTKHYACRYRSDFWNPKMASKMPQDRPKTAPRGSWRATFSLLKIVLNLDSFWVRFWSILASKMEPKKCSSNIFWGIFWGSKMLFVFVLFWVASKTAQEGPRGAQEAPGSPPECPKRSQEGPKSAPGGSKRTSRDPKSRSRGLKTRPRPPKSLPRCAQGFSEAPGSAAVFGNLTKFKAWLQKASTKLKIADIDESQRPCLKSQNEKRRAGGGDPPWGSQYPAGL